jgi:hypothetical protein
MPAGRRDGWKDHQVLRATHVRLEALWEGSCGLGNLDPVVSCCGVALCYLGIFTGQIAWAEMELIMR